MLPRLAGGRRPRRHSGPAARWPPRSQSEIEQFCGNIADAARDRRYALQKQQLEDLRANVDDHIAALEAKRAEYEDWLKRRQDFIEKAKDNLVQIYANMDPDAAAAQLAALHVDLAAAILMKLEPRKASTILDRCRQRPRRR